MIKHQANKGSGENQGEGRDIELEMKERKPFNVQKEIVDESQE